MTKFTFLDIFSLLLAFNQFLTGFHCWHVLSPSNSLPYVPEESYSHGAWDLSPEHSMNVRHGGMSGAALRGRVLRGAYGSDGPFKPDISKQLSSRSNDPVLASLLRQAPARKFNANATIVQLEKGKLNYVDVLVKCAPIIKYCLINSVGAEMCTLSCLLDPFKVSKHTVTMIGTAAKSLCSPIGSVFDTGIPSLQNNENKAKQLSQYFKLLEINQDKYPQFGKSGAAALPMQLIKYGKSPILDTLKPIIATISTSISIAQANFNDLNSVFENSACNNELDLGDPVRRLAEQFITNPFTVDITLGGWFVLSNIAQFKINPLTLLVDSILNTFKLFTGVHCSLIQYAESGMGSNCKEVTGYEGLPKKIKGKKESQLDDICGSLPDVPYIDLNKILPDVFPKEKGPGDTVYYDTGNDEFTGKGFEANMNGLNSAKTISNN